MASAAKIEEAGGQGYQTNHMTQIFKQGMSFSGYERDGLYLSLGGGKFRDISGISGIDSITDGRGAILSDFDNDGDHDIVVTTIQKSSVLLYRNNVGQEGAFLRVTLEGTRSGRDAFGAVVRIGTPLGVQTKIKAGGSGFLSQHDGRLLFGLGKGERVDWLEVVWPSGLRQRFTDIRAGESLRIREATDAPERIRERRLKLVDAETPDDVAWKSLAPAKGDPMPSLALSDLVGNPASLSLLLKPGHRTLINFWATWCAPCRHEMGELQKLQPALAAAGVDLLGISLDFKETDRVSAFLKQNGIDYPVFIAEESSMGSLLKSDQAGVPFTLLVDEKGRLQRILTGWSQATQRAIQDLASSR